MTVQPGREWEQGAGWRLARVVTSLAILVLMMGVLLGPTFRQNIGASVASADPLAERLRAAGYQVTWRPDRNAIDDLRIVAPSGATLAAPHLRLTGRDQAELEGPVLVTDRTGRRYVVTANHLALFLGDPRPGDDLIDASGLAVATDAGEFPGRVNLRLTWQSDDHLRIAYRRDAPGDAFEFARLDHLQGISEIQDAWPSRLCRWTGDHRKDVEGVSAVEAAVTGNDAYPAFTALQHLAFGHRPEELCERF